MNIASAERLVKDTKRVLNGDYWIPTLDCDTHYGRIHDDHDGTNEGVLRVVFDRMGDAFVYITSRTSVDKHKRSVSDFLRYRTHGGGGQSLRVRNALMILAEAIRLDNEEKPIADPSKVQK